MSEAAGVYARESAYLECYVQLGVAQGRVLSVDFPESAPDDAGRDHGLLDRVERYLEGERDEFADVDVAMTMPTGRAAVLEAVREIPYGEDTTVERLARMVPGRDPGDGDDRMAVREALAENPVPIFVPGHRIRDGPGGAPPAIEQKLRSVEGV